MLVQGSSELDGRVEVAIFPAPREPLRKSTHETLVVSTFPECALEPSALRVALGGDLESRLEQLRRAFELALALGDARELEEHLAAGNARHALRIFLPSQDREERAVRALGAIELSIVPRELGACPKNCGVRRIDPGRRVELDEGARSVADDQIEPRQMVVDGRAFLRTSSGEVVDDRTKHRPRFVDPAAQSEGVREGKAHGSFVGSEIAGHFEQRDRACRLTDRAAEKRGSFPEARKTRGLVGGVLCARRERSSEVRVVVARTVKIDEPYTEGLGFGGPLALLLETLDRHLDEVGFLERAHHAEDDLGPLFLSNDVA